MAATGDRRLYEHEDGRLQAVYTGSELDAVLAKDPSWSLVEPKPKAPAAKQPAAKK